MLKKTITYTDYNGNPRTEDFYFNLTRAELMIMQASKVGGLENMMRKIVQDQNGPAIMDNFREIIHKAYGEKSPDGRQFLKKAPDGHDLADDFEQTEAYSELFMELVLDAEAAAKFMNSVLPADLVAAAKEAEANGESPITLLPTE